MKLQNQFYFLCILYDFQSLQDLKNKKSNIIIADIYDERAGVVLCEAYKLQVHFFRIFYLKPLKLNDFTVVF